MKKKSYKIMFGIAKKKKKKFIVLLASIVHGIIDTC